MLNLQSGTSSAARALPWQAATAATSRAFAGRREPFEALSQYATKVRIARGSELFAEGDDTAFCFKILSGDAMAFKLMADGARQVYEFLLPGDFVGIDGETTHYFTVEAVTELVVLKYPRRCVERLMSENPSFAHEIQRITARGLHSAYQRMLLLTHKSADERIAWFLLDMAERSNAQGAVHLSMSRTDIADYLGMVIETVSRALTRFKRAGAIAMQSVNDIRLVDRHRLEAVRGDV